MVDNTANNVPSRSRWPIRLAGILGLGSLLLAGCGTTPPETRVSGDHALQGELIVYAAASLAESFDQLGEEFESLHPEVEVIFNYNGSSALAEQLISGAPADVFASADERNMNLIIEEGLTRVNPELFATNTLTLVAPASNPGGITAFADAAKSNTKLVVCAPQVPCGNATKRVFEDAGLDLSPVSEEGSVTDVLGKVTSEQADAGVVYVTDAQAAGGTVQVFDIPNAQVAVNNYPISVLKDSPNPEAAEEFIDFVTGERGQQVLTEAGFGTP